MKISRSSPTPDDDNFKTITKKETILGLGTFLRAFWAPVPTGPGAHWRAAIAEH